MDDDALRQLPLFAALPPDELRHLAALLRLKHLAPHEILFREGDPGDRFYIVVAGEIEVIKAIHTAEERRISVLSAGEFVGEMSLVEHAGRRTTSIRAQTEVRLLEMTREVFDEALRHNPTLVYELLRVQTARLRAADDTTVRDLREKNRQLTEAYQELQAAQAQIIEKETLEREMRTAREIQESMLPRQMPHYPGYEVGARLTTARTVSGDYFDFFALDGNRLGVVIADVCGKGMPAALYMALSRSLLRAEASRAPSPAEALQSVNRHLLELNDTGMFITLIFGVLDPASGSFSYARAGHDLPLLRNTTGQVQIATPQIGQPLGLFPEFQIDIQHLHIAPGELLLLYTDGVTEAMDIHDALFGRDRLVALVAANPQAGAQALCDTVLAAVLAHHGPQPPSDDVTLCAIRRVG